MCLDSGSGLFRGTDMEDDISAKTKYLPGPRRCSCAEVVLSTGCGDRPTHRDHKEATRNLKQQRKPCARMMSRSARS